MAGAATGIAGALIANFFYTSPTVGETLAILAFVTVSFGGFGSVLGALVAGLIIGVVESLSAYLIGPVYKDVIVYVLFVLVLWFRPQGLMGKAMTPTPPSRSARCVVLVLAYPLLVAGLPVYERLGALVLLAAIGASAWNIVGGYAGQVSVGHAVFFGFGAYSSVVVYTHLGWPPIAGAPLGMLLSVLRRRGDRRADAAPLRPLFQHGHHRRRRAGARAVARPAISWAARRGWAGRPCRAPCSTSPSSRRRRSITSSSPCWRSCSG